MMMLFSAVVQRNSQRLLSGEILGFLLKNGVQYNIGSRDADNFTTDDFDKQ